MKMMSGLVVGRVFNFVSSESSIFIAIIYFFFCEKEDSGGKLKIKSTTESQKWLKSVMALYNSLEDLPKNVYIRWFIHTKPLVYLKIIIWMSSSNIPSAYCNPTENASPKPY